MKMWQWRKRQSGQILAVTLVLALLVGLTVGALLLITQQQNYLSQRSMTWNSEIPLAEAGLEEAMVHVNSRPTSLSTNGWKPDGANVVKTRTFADGYFYTSISTALPPTIVSVGFGRIPLQTNFTHRTVFARTKLAPPGWGIVAKQNVLMSGSTLYVDSFDSSDSRFSGPGGTYDGTKRRDRAGVGTTSTNTGAINTGAAKIYGSVATGPMGTATGTVGDGSWISGGSSGIQDGHFTDDFNMAIPDVVVPAGLARSMPPLPGFIGLTAYTYILGNGDYALPLGLTLGGSMVVTGKARLYVNGATRISGSGSGITILNGGSLELYFHGDVDVGGNGIVNGTQVAAACVLYGTTACTGVRYSGNAELRARLYVPSALVEMVGTSDFSGSVVANAINFKGTPAIHYDEALSGSGPDYRIVAWEEL
jgi:hypothetical protein